MAEVLVKFSNSIVTGILAAFAAVLPLSPVVGASLTSTYTTLDWDKCEVLSQSEEGGGSRETKCPGYKGLSVYVSEGDLRFDIDYGVANQNWDSFSPFNAPNKTIEWVLDNTVAIAAIQRFYLDTGEAGEGPKMQILKISSVGYAEVPGCPIAYVNASANSDTNVLARQAAKTARTFNCQSDQPKIFGRPGDLAQAGIESVQ